MSEHYCGCCGRQLGAGTRTDPMWCADCKKHLIRAPWWMYPPWQRTYFAQYGTDCPFHERTPMCSVCWRPVTFAAVRRGDHRCAHCVAAGRHPS